MWLHHAEALAGYYLDKGKDVDALSIYYRLVQHDPMLEQGHLAIMHIHDRLHNQKAVEMQYQLMVRTLEQEAGVRPGDEVTKWYSDWKGLD